MIYEIKKFQDKKKPQLLVYGHIHHYKRKNADGNHTWVCKNKRKGCRGLALTDSMEEDAILIQSPELHSCSEYNKKKATATKLNSIEDSESDYSLHSAAQEEQVAPFSNESETHESISKTKREDTVLGNDNKISNTKFKSRSRASQSRSNMKKCQIANAEGKGNNVIQKTNTNNLYKFQF